MTDTSLTDVTVFPEDKGTNGSASAGRDIAHAAQIATLAARQGARSYIETGFVPTAGGTIPAGTAFVRYEGGSQTYDEASDSFSAWDSPVIFTVELHSDETGLAFEADASSDVYLAIDLAATDGDGAYIRHGSAVQEPTDPSVKLGVVDTAAGEVTPSAASKGPVGDYRLVDVGGLSVGGGSTLDDLLGTNLSQANGTLEATDTDTQLTTEEVQDIVGAFVSGGTNVTASYDDANDTLTIESTDTDTQLSNEEVEDIVAGLLAGSGSTTVSYDDSNDVLTIESTDTDTQLSDEQVQDIVGPFVNSGTNVSVNYDDGNNTLTISATDTDTTYSAGSGLSLSSQTFSTESVPTSDLDQSGATTDQHLAWDGSAWVPADPPSGTNTQAYSTAASGSVSLNGSETVDIDTGVAVNSKFYVPECNPPPDCDYVVSVRRDDSGTGNWVIRFEQNDTGLTSGTVNWRLKEDLQ